jgi:acetylornithine deacetylase/succinyl-diaminopimelate desuccinylase-like protein
VITGFTLPDANIHSPNERIRIDYLPRGIAAARALFIAWGELPQNVS